PGPGSGRWSTSPRGPRPRRARLRTPPPPCRRGGCAPTPRPRVPRPRAGTTRGTRPPGRARRRRPGGGRSRLALRAPVAEAAAHALARDRGAAAGTRFADARVHRVLVLEPPGSTVEVDVLRVRERRA